METETNFVSLELGNQQAGDKENTMKKIQQMSTEELKNLLEGTLNNSSLEEYDEAAYAAINQELLSRREEMTNK